MTATPPAALRLPQRMVDPLLLAEHPRNYRRHADAAIRGSIREVDQVQPVTINRGTLTGRPDEILGGHGTVKAWIDERPGELLQVSEVDVDDRKALKILLALNRSHELGQDDEEAVFAALAELDGDYGGTSYTEDDYDALRSDLTITDEAPPPGPRDKFTFDEPHRSGTRIMVLEFPLDAFKWTQKHLGDIAETMGVMSNVDVVVRLIADRVGERPPPTALEAEDA